MEDGDWWQISVIAEEFAVPSALEGAVMYQIFPDRFAKSGQADLHDKLQPYWIHSNTHDIPVWQPNERGEVTNNDFFGGNFAGMCEKLDYLHDFGVEVLYLNPIFMAWSTHRYDTYDYARIDPMLGTRGRFPALLQRGARARHEGHSGRRVLPRRRPQPLFPECDF